MKIKLKYFAQMAEITNKREEELKFQDGMTLKELISFLVQKYGNNLKNYLLENGTDNVKNFFKILINGKLMDFQDILLTKDSEVVIIPPVSGG
ncbi:MAG: MoaD/ThiS family protein [Candidatus Helarchaeota archaeon]